MENRTVLDTILFNLLSIWWLIIKILKTKVWKICGNIELIFNSPKNFAYAILYFVYTVFFFNFTIPNKSQTMSSNREKKLNRADVRSGIMKFILSFVVLSGVSFICVFFFFKSYDIQREGIKKEADNYRELLTRSDLLRIHVDSILYRMDQLDINKVNNDIFLRNYIMDNVISIVVTLISSMSE